MLSERGLDDWRALRDSPLFDELVREGKVVATRELDDAPALPDVLHSRTAAVLEHEPVPFVSYPYEWTFGMLRDAALLHLELVRRALEANLMLKDATPYNVQFRGPQPLFVDVGSFERLREGEPWAGYRQFCMLFLYPLLLHAWRGVPFQPWLRGRVAGISPTEMRALLSARDVVRRGALTHVVLHARLERRHADTADDLKRELRSAGFRKELIAANVRGLERLLSRLSPAAARTAWSEYAATTSYTQADADAKERFVADAVAAESPRVVWDIGSNDGRHARIAARTAQHVLAIDADAVVLDRLYEELKRDGGTNVQPLLVDVTDASPGLGWRGAERRPLEARGRPDLALCLAVVHHVSIGGNVPVTSFLDWLRDLARAVVVEFPTPDDRQVARMLARKREHDHPDYRRDWFERCLDERFDVVATHELAGGRRVLYRARAR